MDRVPTALIAGLSLLVGFGSVRVTDLRWLGGLVVVAGAVWCVARERRRTSWWRLALVVVFGAGCFVLSHALSDPLGPWPAVAVASLALGAVTFLLVDARAARQES